MSKKKIIEAAAKKGVFLYDDHKLVTRRDFLGAGLIQFSAAIVAPTVLSSIIKASVAQAAVCDDSAGSALTGLPAFVQLNLSGGCGLAANYVPRQRDGNLMASMSLMGLGGATLMNTAPAGNITRTDRLESELGTNKGFFLNSQFLAGMKQVAATAGIATTAATYMDRTAFVGVCVQSRDDTNMNKVGLASLVSAAGVVGSKMNVLSSGFGASPTLIAPPTPILVGSTRDLDSAVGVAAPLGDLTKGTDSKRLQAVFKLIKGLSESRAQALLSSNASTLQNAVGCATDKNVAVSGAPKPATSPLTNPLVAAVWGLQNNTAIGSRQMVFAGCVYNSLIQQAGASQLNNGGNDYHNNTRTAGDAKDLENGRLAGQILQTAAVLGKPCFLYVTTDGSVRSDDSVTDTSAWTSDRGQAGIAYVLAYSPNSRPALANTTLEPGTVAMPNQIGYFANQSADNSYLSSWDPERASLAVFANYLKFGQALNPAAVGSGPDAWLTLYKSLVPKAAESVGLPSMPLTDADLRMALRF